MIVKWISDRVPCRHMCTQLCDVPPMIGAPIYFGTSRVLSCGNNKTMRYNLLPKKRN